MGRIVSAAALAGALLSAVPAAAQAPAALTRGPSNGRLFIGGSAGVGGAGKTSALAGGEFAFHLTDRIDVFGEGLGLQDLVTRPRRALATAVGTALAASQGRAVSSSIKVPAFYGGGGIRIMFRNAGRVHPFVTVGGGMARLTLKPAFVLGGSDVTASLSQYGVTLGTDLSGTLMKPAVNGGVGVRTIHDRWYLDGGLRLTRVFTDDPRINYVGVGAGFGLRF